MLFQAWVRTSLGFLATIVLSACAGTTVNYTPPNVSKGNIETERTIDADFETVWDQYVAEPQPFHQSIPHAALRHLHIWPQEVRLTGSALMAPIILLIE